MKTPTRTCWLRTMKRMRRSSTIPQGPGFRLQLPKFPGRLYDLVDLTARERYEKRKQQT